MIQKSVPAWFEIPASDFERAVGFYEKLLDIELKRESMGPMQLAVFPNEKPHPTGALVAGNGAAPSTAGSVIYLNLDDIRPALARAPKFGAEVLVPLTQLPDEIGVFAQIRDSEGNRVGLYSAR
jgi:predicted enzyme related to lactoylglutathione lyase